MSEISTHRGMFGIKEVGFPPDDKEVLARQAAITAAIQPDGLKWLVFSAGRFADGGAAIRFAFETQTNTAKQQFEKRLKSTLRSAASALTVEPLRDWFWFDHIYVFEGRERKVLSSQVLVPLPQPDINVPGHSLWLSSLLDGLGSLPESNSIGVSFYMRPAAEDSEVWRDMRIEIEKSRERVGTSRTIVALDDAYRSGAWWIDIRCFAEKPGELEELEAMLVSHISQMGKDFSSQPSGRAPRIIEHPSRRHPLLLSNPTTVDHSTPLEQAGINVGVLETKQKTLLKNAQRPYQFDHFVTGRNLWSLLQLPAHVNPLIRVERGFGYCVVPSEPGQLILGTHTPSSIETERGIAVRMNPDELTKHMLVVGATGSGKTTTVRSILAQLKETLKGRDQRICITVLEGAKREYHAGGSLWGMEKRYTLQGDDFLELNIFEHPEEVEPEAHLSMVASIFESALDMPTPLPALLREALMMAYSAYHSAPPQVKSWQPHPVRYWLANACEQVLEKAGYGGENGQNISAALRTRLRDLSMGAGGRVLSGCQIWEALKVCLASQNSVIEMESIPDAHNRSLVMSLFVLYYRYALCPSKELRNVLVVEEAHRIIGKSAHHDDSHEAFSQMLAEVRQLGCGVIISDQSPNRLIDDAMRNTNTKVLMRLVSGDDIGSAVRGAGLPVEAASDIPNLRQGQAILVTPTSRPTIVKIKHVQEPTEVSSLSLHRTTPEAFARDFEAVTSFAGTLTKLRSGATLRDVFPLELVDEDGQWAATKIVDAAKLEVGCDCMNRQFARCSKHGALVELRAILLTEMWIRKGKVRMKAV